MEYKVGDVVCFWLQHYIIKKITAQNAFLAPCSISGQMETYKPIKRIKLDRLNDMQERSRQVSAALMLNEMANLVHRQTFTQAQIDGIEQLYKLFRND